MNYATDPTLRAILPATAQPLAAALLRLIPNPPPFPLRIRKPSLWRRLLGKFRIDWLPEGAFKTRAQLAKVLKIRPDQITVAMLLGITLRARDLSYVVQMERREAAARLYLATHKLVPKPPIRPVSSSGADFEADDCVEGSSRTTYSTPIPEADADPGSWDSSSFDEFEPAEIYTPACNINGMPMVPGTGVDVTGNAFGVTNDLGF